MARTKRTNKRPATSEMGADASRLKTSSQQTPETVKSEPDESVTACESLDKYGDLILRFGPERTSYRVCSRALARASSVLDEMLYGPKSRSRASSAQWTLNFRRCENPQVGLFLRIAHGHSASVPHILSVLDFCQLLRCLESFKAISIIQPWVQGWISNLSEDTGDIRLLCISWTVGDSKLFRKVLRKIAEGRSIDKDGKIEHDDSWNGSYEALLGCFNSLTASEITGKPQQ